MTLATLLRPRISFRHEAPWMRLTARAILAGWLLPLVFTLLVALSSVPAHAQDAPQQTVVVLDFATGSGIDPLLGRKAADALAVELQRSNEFVVVPRQRLNEAVSQSGIKAPFNDTAQIQLAQAVGATSVFSGQITGVQITPNQSARVGVLVRQLDAGTGDYINGTQNIESTEQKLSAIANETLVDEAINKAAFAAVRSMRQTTLPFGSVLNTTRDDLELSIGARNGVGVGQRYTVLRDVFNQGRNVTERVKIGEITIGRVEADQATARLSAGGAAGVRTGDFVREIFQSPTTSLAFGRSNNNLSSTPVSAPPVRLGNRNGITKSTLGKGVLGLFGLGALVALVGFGGGGNNTSPQVGQPFESDPNGLYPVPSVIFTNGFTGVAKSLQGESVVGYIIYRGTSANFAATTDNIQGFINASNASVGSRQSFSEPFFSNGASNGFTRSVSIIANPNTVVNGNSTGTGATINVVESNLIVFAVNSFIQTQTSISFTFTQQPLQIGQQYFYRVQRISAERVGSINNNGTTTGGTTTGSRVNLLPFRSPSSNPTGGYTPLLRPVISPNPVDTTTGFAYDLANFSVTLNARPDITQFINSGAATGPGSFFFFVLNNGYFLPTGTNVTTGADTFEIQVSTSPSFSAATTFVSQDFSTPTVDATGSALFTFPNGITLPGGAQFVSGSTQLFLRALSRRSTDANPIFRISPTVTIPASQVADSRNPTTGSSRLVDISKRGGGLRVGQGRGLNGHLQAGAMPATTVGRPR